MTDIVSNDASVTRSLVLNQFVDAAAAGGNTRTLDFISSELGENVDLLLMFEPPKVGKLFVDLFPVCWKVLSFSSTGISSANVVYSADSGFFVPQFQAGNRVAASNAQHCQTGQKCTLKANESGGNFLTAAEAGTAGVLQCLNGTERPANLGIGFFNDAGNRLDPVLVWENIAKGSTLSVQLTPKLKIYAVSNFKATELIRGDIESPVLFEQNLIALPSFSEWTVSKDVGTGEIRIEQA